MLQPQTRPRVQATVAFVLADVVAVGGLGPEALAAQVAAEQRVLQALVHSHVLLQKVPVHEATGTD